MATMLTPPKKVGPGNNKKATPGKDKKDDETGRKQGQEASEET